jgi:hypothetical protein
MASGLISTYLGEGTAAARPASPNIGAGVIAFWFSTDTGEGSAYVNGAWLEDILHAIHVGTTAPSSPAVNDLWVDTN